jgi:hypothetical protein
LRDPRVTELTVDAPQGTGSLSQAAGNLRAVAGDTLVERAAHSAVEEILRRHPIYRLDAARSKREAKAIRHLRSARIDGEDLLLEVGL